MANNERPLVELCVVADACCISGAMDGKIKLPFKPFKLIFQFLVFVFN